MCISTRYDVLEYADFILCLIHMGSSESLPMVGIIYVFSSAIREVECQWGIFNYCIIVIVTISVVTNINF